MGWATAYIERLRAGEPVKFRPRGGSMAPLVKDGQLVEVIPFDGSDAQVDDIVLCKVRGREYLHLVKAVRSGHVLIGNNRGGVNGWISPKAIFGRMVAVCD